MFNLVLFISCFYFGRAIDCGGKKIVNTITVDQHKKGAFHTIQAAIDSIKKPNDRWVMINIGPGTYKEQIFTDIRMSCIILKGSSRHNTIITHNKSFHDGGQTMSATFHSSPPNVILSGIKFQVRKRSNTFGYNGPAVAASIHGDKTAIFDCSFIGYQDTLLSAKGRQYFKNCYIQGEVDFICGDGQSYFENCVMNATQGKSRPSGFVTAQRRDNPNDPSGFVFRGGSIVGNGKVKLGRPWRPYARVIFWGTYFSSVISPRGWDVWNSKIAQVKETTFAEINCRGPGANTKRRVKWEKKPKDLNLNKYTLSSFINNDRWLDNLPSI
ncbi:putative pectinesterase 10 [Trifolium pratense]|uniref:putative pectinesterase 10 n=1 Tax=Trifolium pratense TaxID=57577 RepID=UPI001E691097|nr:putative pectinesterase 10 [Trifolium pratense]